MQELNKEQQKAVKTTEGYIRVISGAGTGKTRIITNRYVHLVNEVGIANANILCVTFTNNASKEMKHRIDNMIKDKDVGYICTFHSLSSKALREDIHCVDIAPNFVVMDDEDKNFIFRKIYHKLGITNRDYHYEDMQEFINKTKARQDLITVSNNPIDYIKHLSNNCNDNSVLPDDTVESRFFNEYISEQRKNSMLDYNDLINIFLYILVKFEDKRVKWQKRFQYIMCDEFNDIDRKQYQLLMILSQYHKNLLIVGDPDQTIYSWRGSDVNYIINFPNDFEGTQDIIVNENYRSVPSVLGVANSLIKHNINRIDKDLVPNRTEDKKVIYSSLKNPEEEAKWLVEQIVNMLEQGESPDNIAVLYRNNRLSRNIEEELITKGIKYCVYSGVDFYNRKEIKDLLSYLRFIIYEKDIDFQRIIKTPARGIGKVAMDNLIEYSNQHNSSIYQALKDNLDNGTLKKAKVKEFITFIEDIKQKYNQMNLIDLVDEVLKKSGYQEELNKHNEQERLENIEELKHGITEFIKTDIEEKTLQEYLDKISLYTNSDRTSKEKAVKLMTIHSAKGLEFKNVFIVRINDGIMPSGKVKSAEGIEEERRLFYVALTRAKDRLVLTNTQVDFNDYENECSRFLKELDVNYIEFVDEQSKERLKNEKRKPTVIKEKIQTDFKVGDKVMHFAFGKGVVKEINEAEQIYSIQFDNCETIRNISMHIKLERVD